MWASHSLSLCFRLLSCKKGVTIALILLGLEQGPGTETATAFYIWNNYCINGLNDIIIEGKGGIHDVARFLAWGTYVNVMPVFGSKENFRSSVKPIPQICGAGKAKRGRKVLGHLSICAPVSFMKGWAF